MDFHKSITNCDIVSTFSRDGFHSPQPGFKSVKRDSQGIEIDPDYEPHLIIEHCVDSRRWPKGRKSDYRGGFSSSDGHSVETKAVIVFTGGKTYRVESIHGAVERFGSWVHKRLYGEVKNTEKQWAMTEEKWKELNIVGGVKDE